MSVKTCPSSHDRFPGGPADHKTGWLDHRSNSRTVSVAQSPSRFDLVAHFDMCCFPDTFALCIGQWNQPNILGEGRDSINFLAYPFQTASQFKMHQKKTFKFHSTKFSSFMHFNSPRSSPGCELEERDPACCFSKSACCLGSDATGRACAWAPSSLAAAVPHCTSRVFSRAAIFLAFLGSSSLEESSSVGLLSGLFVVASCHWLLKP